MFETPLAATHFLDAFAAAGGSWAFPDPLHVQQPQVLRLRRDLDFNGRQLYLSLGRARALLTDLFMPKGLEVGSAGL
eukprot:3257432-Pyramimonas_sp.AAC.1